MIFFVSAFEVTKSHSIVEGFFSSEREGSSENDDFHTFWRGNSY